ncbi:MAG: peptidoglycan -binding protein [Henriciella sp.]|nr:peptidoglycan -binding protein [Henriciella sp.]
MSVLELTPGSVSLAELELFYRSGRGLRQSRSARKGVEAAAEQIARAVRSGEPVYGVNTGFGKLASVKIPGHDTAKLQRNLILSHCCGVGEVIDPAITRLMMALKLMSLGRGASGVRWPLIELIENMLIEGVIPRIPAQGSVGASGDLAPLAPMAAVIMGEGEAVFEGEKMSGAAALAAAGLAPVLFGPKDGLALINGTQFSTAFALAGLFGAWQAAQSALTSELAQVHADAATAQAALEAQLARVTAEGAGAQAALSDELSKARADAATRIAALEADLVRVRADLAIARASVENTAEDRASVEARLLQALESLERTQAAAASDQEVLRARLAAALAAREDAETAASDQSSLAEQRAALLAKAREALSEQEAISLEAQRQTALLNQQVAALRTQLGGLQALLDDSKERDAATNVQLQNLGSNLNAALARAASEERKRRLLEEAERKRLEIEAAQKAAEAAQNAAEAETFKAQAKDLERYRSEFFGRLRDVLGNQEGVRIEGDRFVFSSEVLFPPGGAELSVEGQIEIAKVANILRSIADDIPPEIDWVIRVDGHTDDTPLVGHSKYADNWELSQGRALSVVRYMVEALAIPPDRLAANGFGEFQPINRAATPEARAQNRRIGLKFTEKERA